MSKVATISARVLAQLTARGYTEQPWWRELHARLEGRWVFRDDALTFVLTTARGSMLRYEALCGSGLRAFRPHVLGRTLDARVPYFHVARGRLLESVAPAWVERLSPLKYEQRRKLVVGIHTNDAACTALMLGGIDSARAVLGATAKGGK